MTLYKLKPIQWIIGNKGIRECHSCTHHYIIRYDSNEKCYRIDYYNYITRKSNNKYCNSISEAKQWVENTHIPAKLKQYMEKVT